VVDRQRADVRQWTQDGIAGGQIKPDVARDRHAEQFVVTIACLTDQPLVSTDCIGFAPAHHDLKRTMRRALLAAN
jgi:hypothetical protein